MMCLSRVEVYLSLVITPHTACLRIVACEPHFFVSTFSRAIPRSTRGEVAVPGLARAGERARQLHHAACSGSDPPLPVPLPHAHARSRASGALYSGACTIAWP